MELLFIVGIVLAFVYAAARWGYDSRDLTNQDYPSPSGRG